MTDPLAEMVLLLQPSARFSKVAEGSGAWRILRNAGGHPFYQVLLKGRCLLTTAAGAVTLRAGDFVLVPAGLPCVISSLDPAPPEGMASQPVMQPDGTRRFGIQDGPPDQQMLIGHFSFGSPDAALLTAMLPQLIHVRGQKRLATLVDLVIEESRANRPARDVILSRLLEVLLVEALRSVTGITAPGLLRGLADERLAQAIRRIHEDPARAWTIAGLAQEASLSRSAFFARFQQALGMAPMAYLSAWRMAQSKSLLRQRETVAEVAARVGYGSASAFSTAFARHVGMPPARYAQSVVAA